MIMITGMNDLLTQELENQNLWGILTYEQGTQIFIDARSLWAHKNIPTIAGVKP